MYFGIAWESQPPTREGDQANLQNSTTLFWTGMHKLLDMGDLGSASQLSSFDDDCLDPIPIPRTLFTKLAHHHKFSDCNILHYYESCPTCTSCGIGQSSQVGLVSSARRSDSCRYRNLRSSKQRPMGSIGDAYNDPVEVRLFSFRLEENSADFAYQGIFRLSGPSLSY